MLRHEVGIPEPGALKTPQQPAVRSSPSPSISRDEILVVGKMSRFEREKLATHLTDDELIARFNALGESGLRILSAHLRHQEALAICAHEVRPEQIVSLESLENSEIPPRCKLIIALGGDDFFKLVSHRTPDGLPILGVNSDPASSVGALLPITIEQLPEALQRLEVGDYRFEPWTKLSLTIDGVEQGSAISDIVLGKRDFRLTSRHELEYRGEKVTQRSSGILISTGAGSTGWYASAGLYLGGHDRSFAKTARFARFELREPPVTVEEVEGARVVRLPKLVEGIIHEGETLRITSLNDEEGLASRDSLDSIPFPRGSVAEISIDPNPHNVVIPGDTSCSL
jgi:NAD+ kinase